MTKHETTLSGMILFGLLCLGLSTGGSAVLQGSEVMFSEDWANGIDPAIWQEYGAPLPVLVNNPCDETLGVDPNGDGWCQSGMMSLDQVWFGHGCRVGMDFMTNVDLEPRQLHYQNIQFGLSSGWQTTGNCAYEAAEAEVFVTFEPQTNTEVIRIYQRDIGILFEAPYPASEDGICHHAELHHLPGGSYGLVELWYDGERLATVALQASLPETLYLFVDGRSIGMTNAVDNLFADCLDYCSSLIGVDLSCLPSAGTVPFTSGFSLTLANRLGRIGFQENWESGIDAEEWTAYGAPAPEVNLTEGWEGSTGIDPNGDGWCQSGLASTEVVPWGPGDSVGMQFITNAHGDSRQYYYQNIQFGLSSGWQTTGNCANEAVEAEVLVYFFPELSAEAIRIYQRNVGMLFEAPYPASEDGIWHSVSLRRVPGGPYGAVELWYDCSLLTTEPLLAPVPETLHLFVDGRSIGMTNVVDNLYAKEAGGSGWTRRIAAKIDASLASGTTITNWRSGYTNVSSGSSFATTWAQMIPALGFLIGVNTFQVTAQDVTPSPYNQPPYPLAGDTATDACTVTANAP